MSLFRNAVRQENRKARFKAGAEHGVDAKRLMADDFHRALITIARIIVKIIGQHASVLDFACAQ